MPALIVRNHGGALCGYVGVAPGHPLYRHNYHEPHECLSLDLEKVEVGKRGVIPLMCGVDDMREGRFSPETYFDVHGGITFSDGCQEAGHICHTPEPGQPDNVWWFGFDCAHAGDVSPGYRASIAKMFDQVEMAFRDRIFKDDVYRDVTYVKAEIGSLARQLQAVAGSPNAREGADQGSASAAPAVAPLAIDDVSIPDALGHA